MIAALNNNGAINGGRGGSAGGGAGVDNSGTITTLTNSGGISGSGNGAGVLNLDTIITLTNRGAISGGSHGRRGRVERRDDRDPVQQRHDQRRKRRL